MEPPTSVAMIGSYPLGTCIKPRVSVDLMVTIPSVSHSYGKQVYTEFCDKLLTLSVTHYAPMMYSLRMF